MKTVHNKETRLILEKRDGFSLVDTLESGQCFHYQALGERRYAVVAWERLLFLEETEDKIYYETSEEEFSAVWKRYFDLQRDYQEMQKELVAKDAVLKEAVDFAPGIHILRQEFFECLLSFILSQNNRIGKIKAVVKNISRVYGKKLLEIGGESYYAFPSAEALAEVTAEDYKALGAGFRAPYLYDAVQKILKKEVFEEAIAKMSIEEARAMLMKIKGVGPKVSDCVLLFSFGRMEVFPIDVWIKRIMEQWYCNNQEVPVKRIQEMAAEKFGGYAGYAQQYLFHLARVNRIGVKK